MAEHPIQGVMATSMEKIREMVDVSTVIGDPIVVNEHVTVLPVSKISLGFASGGTDLPSKSPKDTFGGGGGAGMNIVPVAFLVINDGDVKLMQLNSDKASPAGKAVDMVPDVLDKISAIFSSKKEDKDGE